MFTPKDDRQRAETTRKPPAPPPPKPEPIEWSRDRVEPVLTGLGLLLHELDPVASTPYGDELWKFTEDDLKAIAGPAARIANRYSVVRQVAGHSDEVAVGLGLGPYVKRNLSTRGRAKTQLRRGQALEPAQQLEPARSQPETHAAERNSPPEQPARQPAGEPAGSQPEARAGSPAGFDDELGLGLEAVHVPSAKMIPGDVFDPPPPVDDDLFGAAATRDAATDDVGE